MMNFLNKKPVVLATITAYVAAMCYIAWEVVVK